MNARYCMLQVFVMVPSLVLLSLLGTDGGLMLMVMAAYGNVLYVARKAVVKEITAWTAELKWMMKTMSDKEFWCALFITWIYCNGDFQKALQMMGVAEE